MKIPFLGPAYASRSPILGSQTAINIYPELAEAGGDEVGAFYGTPGLTTVYTGSGEVRGMRAAGGYLFAVIGNTVYRFNSALSATSLGTLTTSTGRVTIISNDTQIAFIDSVAWYWTTFAGVALTTVTNGPASAIADTMDSYVLFTYPGTGSFGITALADLSTISALDLATAEGLPDNLVSLAVTQRDVFLFGETSTEVWNNTGAAVFPFERAPSGFIEQGCCAARSPTKLDNSLFWLGRDKNGQGMVFRNNGFLPIRISTHALEYAINQYSDISDAIGWSYQEEGHSFYVLTFPTGNATWVYDVSTKMWHQRAWQDSTGYLNRHRGNCFAAFNGDFYVGDWQNGKIYRQSLDVYTDDGEEIYRERAFEVSSQDGKRIRLDRFELNLVQGDGITGDLDVSLFEYILAEDAGHILLESGSLIYLENSTAQDNNTNKVGLAVSRDYGVSFGYERFVHLGRTGKRRARAVWRRLGLARYPVLKVFTTMAKRVHWLSASLDAEASQL